MFRAKSDWARRCGAAGGKASTRHRRGDSEWGKALGRLSRPRTRWQQRGGRAQKRCYPGLWRVWLENARRAQRGLAPIPVPLVMTPGAIRMRELRALRRRRAAYERAKNGGG